MMKYVYIFALIILLNSCAEKCEVCEVLKNGHMIEKYESCDEGGIKLTKSMCIDMAKLQNSECECHTINKGEE